jgi:hypothetical protein
MQNGNFEVTKSGKKSNFGGYKTGSFSITYFFLAKFDASWCIFTSTQDSEKYNIFKKNLLKKKYHDHLNEEKKGSIT